MEKVQINLLGKQFVHALLVCFEEDLLAVMEGGDNLLNQVWRVRD